MGGSEDGKDGKDLKMGRECEYANLIGEFRSKEGKWDNIHAYPCSEGWWGTRVARAMAMARLTHALHARCMYGVPHSHTWWNRDRDVGGGFIHFIPSGND